MTEPIEARQSPALRTPDANRSGLGRVIDRLSVPTERAIVPAVYVLLTVGFLGIGLLAIAGVVTLLPTHPAVALLGVVGVFAVGAAAPSLARSVLIRVVDSLTGR